MKKKMQFLCEWLVTCLAYYQSMFDTYMMPNAKHALSIAHGLFTLRPYELPEIVKMPRLVL